MLCILWALPWLLAVSGLASARFAYVATVLVGLAVTLGQFLRVDTLALALVACVVAQTALWPALDTSALRHALFILDEPPRWFMLAVSALMFGLSCVSVNRFKKAA